VQHTTHGQLFSSHVFACGKKTSVRGLSSNLQIQYGSNVSVLQKMLQCTAIVWSFCGLMTGYSFHQLKPKKGTLQKQLIGNTLHSHLLKRSFIYLNLIDKIDPLVSAF